MANFSYKQAPNSGPQYKVVLGGDKYTFFYDDKNNSVMGTVVNYSVANNILNQASGWSTVSVGAYDTNRTNTLNRLADPPGVIHRGTEYFVLNKETFFAIYIDDNVLDGTYFSETVNYNRETLEYNILRNGNPTYVTNLYNFLKRDGGGEPIDQDFYNEIRLFAYDEIVNEAAGGASDG